MPVTKHLELAGYIHKNGYFVMEDWYKDNLEKANKNNQHFFDSEFTGKSPYLIELTCGWSESLITTYIML